MTPGIQHIGMWTWGGRVFNWKKYLDHMRLAGMDTAVFWHADRAPYNAREIQDYARLLGIRILWGFNWSWNSPICLNSDEDAAHWREIVLNLIRCSYAPLHPSGIVFQVGGTEQGAKCRLDCAVCRAEYARGIGRLYMKFAGHILNAVRAEFPDLYLCANVHMGGIHQGFRELAALPPAVNIMWEDLPGPTNTIQVPFAYFWADAAADLQEGTVDMVRAMCQLRGDQEDVAFIVKGFPCRWGGGPPMLLEDFELKALAAIHDRWWKDAGVQCELKLEQALRVFRVIAESSARRKTVLLLVEYGLWELQRNYAASLIVEALKNPFRDPSEIVRAAREQTV